MYTLGTVQEKEPYLWACSQHIYTFTTLRVVVTSQLENQERKTQKRVSLQALLSYDGQARVEGAISRTSQRKTNTI